jgi:hypothetical protein
VAKEGVREKIVIEARDVHGHKGALPPREIVDGAGDEFLAYSALAGDQDR